MTIQAIGTAGAALYLSPEDLRAEGFSCGELPPERALEVIRRACRRAGIALEGPLEIDAFPSGKGVLLFARTCRPRRHWLVFDCIEDLLAGGRALAEPPEEAALFWWEGRWWLSLPAEETRSAAVLSEFGQPCRPGEGAEARIEEHGAQVFSRAAFARLRDYFPRFGEEPPGPPFSGGLRS